MNIGIGVLVKDLYILRDDGTGVGVYLRIFEFWYHTWSARNDRIASWECWIAKRRGSWKEGQYRRYV